MEPTRVVKISFDYMLDEDDLAAIGRAWELDPEDEVTDDMIQGYAQDALSSELMNER